MLSTCTVASSKIITRTPVTKVYRLRGSGTRWNLCHHRFIHGKCREGNEQKAKHFKPPNVHVWKSSSRFMPMRFYAHQPTTSPNQATSFRLMAAATRSAARLSVTSSRWTKRLIVEARRCPSRRPAMCRLSPFMTACEACACRTAGREAALRVSALVRKRAHRLNRIHPPAVPLG